LALIGEGLAARFEFLPRLDAQQDAQWCDLIQGLFGIAAVSRGAVKVVEGPRVLPMAQYRGFAAWDFVDMDRYRAVWMKRHGYFSLNMAGSRGCSFRCAWCAKPTWGNQYLQRSASDVAFEMGYLKRHFGADHIWFADDIFGLRVDWVIEFAAAARASGRVPFTIQTRADLISERMAHALGEAGCQEAWIGAESGSQRMLDAMNKGTTVTEVRTARARLKTAGIRVGFFIQLGYMGEELADILATRELLAAAAPDEIGVSVAYPLPGTRFHELVKEQLGRKTRWRESNDLEMMFHGTYTSDFYRAVRNLLHDQISLQSMAGRADPHGAAAVKSLGAAPAGPHDAANVDLLGAAGATPLGAPGVHLPGAAGADPLGAAGVEHFRSMSALEQRWAELLHHEAQYRSRNGLAAARG
jgi:anaerobic magnesium-protoporphyrin IX monomethyl ester cyclase